MDPRAPRTARARSKLGAAAIGLLAAASAGLPARPAAAQQVIDRSPNLSGGWIGVPGYFYAVLPHRFRDADPGDGFDVVGSTTFDLSLALPRRLRVGTRLAPWSGAAFGENDAWEVYARAGLLEAARGAPVDLSAAASYDGAAEAPGAALTLARWLGPLRVIAEARGLGESGRDLRAAGSAGLVLHVRAGALPIAVAADYGGFIEPDPGEDAAWSAGLQIGLPHTWYTLSLHVSNTDATTMHGISRGGDDLWYGFELTIPVATSGHILGIFTPRSEAAGATVADVETPPGARVDIARYAFTSPVLEVTAGTTIEWTNRDAVVHTVSADDGTFDSGAIRPGQTWRARFDRPGRYPYFCGPHPFMQGMIVVR